MLLTFTALLLCAVALAFGLALRHEIGLAMEGNSAWHLPIAPIPSSRWSLATSAAVFVWGNACGAWMVYSMPWAGACSLASAAALCGLTWSAGQRGKMLYQAQEIKEMTWIVHQRGSVQDQIMRACEREAMERRLRRCQTTLMLTRRGGNDLSQLFHSLEEQVAGMHDDAMDAADVVGGFAAHLRHVFIESDVDDIPLGEACKHVGRWAQVLEKLGTANICISGVPAPDADEGKLRIPALLMLGATERLGVAALQNPSSEPMHWHWSIGKHTVRLEATGGAPLQLGGHELRDWDAAFMLRHGGLAHAGGAWSFELPLLPRPQSGHQAAGEVVQ